MYVTWNRLGELEIAHEHVSIAQKKEKRLTADVVTKSGASCGVNNDTVLTSE